VATAGTVRVVHAVDELSSTLLIMICGVRLPTWVGKGDLSGP